MADKPFLMGSEFPEAYGGGCQPQDQYMPYGHYNNNYAPLETTAGGQINAMSTPPAVGGMATTARCYANSPSVSQQYHADTSKTFYPTAGGANYPTNNSQASYANATANAKKFGGYDPFGYQQSRSPQPNFQQQQHRLNNHQQSQASFRPFFDGGDHSHHHFQQVRQPLSGGPPAGPALPAGFHPQNPQTQTRAPHHHHSSPQQQQIPANQFLPGGGAPFPNFQPPAGSNQRHHQQPPHPQAFFPLGPPNGAATGGPMNPNYENGEMQQQAPLQAPFIYGGDGGGGQMANGHMAMNGAGGGGAGGIEFNEDFGAPDGGINGAMPAQYVLSQELLEKIQNSPKRKALFELQIGLEQIAYDVSNIFDTWASVIKDRIVGSDPLPEPERNIAAAILVEMSVVLDDSQYNYSRLGQFLSRTIDNFAIGFLLPQVSTFISETNTFLSVQHQRNLVLFLAELYDKLDIKGIKCSELAAHLFDQLRNLLKLSPFDDQTVNLMVKVLKLVGRFLENDRGPQAMVEFLTEFDQTVQATAAQLSESAKDKVRALLELRENKWGVVAEIPLAGGGGTASAAVTIAEPPEGQLTEDECAFMEENLDPFGNSPGGSQAPNAFEQDNVEDDFEKFLQATAIRAAEKALEKVSIDEDDDASGLSSPKFSASK